MTTNAEWMLKNGYKFNELDCNRASDIYEYDITLNGKCIERVTSYTCFNALKEWLDAEHIEPILDDAEKRYLSAVLMPFRNKTMRVVKRSMHNGSEEWLGFGSEKGSFYLPNFKAGTMYKGMKLDKLYTLEELGL